MEIPPINQTIMEGEEAQFMCSPKDNTSKVTWYKDDIPISEYQALNQRTVKTEDGTLIIYPSEMTDTGEYRCIVTHPDGRTHNASASLDVQCEYQNQLKQLLLITNFSQSQSDLRPRRGLSRLWKTSSPRLSLPR